MQLHKTKIGKDVIESLTLGMYDDSRFIYREYIQNSVDQIDIAVEQGIINSNSDGYIEIAIDQSEHTISIYDNATGILSNKVEDILKNVAFSPKDIEKRRGFRGIGRLGGLGYCDVLIFETSAKGENKRSILKWDAKKLKQIIHDREKKEEAAEIIDNVTEYKDEEESADAHYFKVTLQGVKNSDLLNVISIRDYLSMVAPVPYSKGFTFKSKIHDKFNQIGKNIDEYKIYVNSDPLYKEYTSRIYEGELDDKKSIDEILDIEFFDVTSPNSEESIALCWYSISNFTKQIPGRANPARGIRLRKGNIQIGSERTLIKLFREQRGNFYFFGEVHAFSNHLIPNARRDYFEESETLTFFENELKKLFGNKLEKLYRFSSNTRNKAKRIIEYKKFTEEYKKKKENGFIDKSEQNSFEEKLNQKKEMAEKAKAELQREYEKIEKDSPERKILDNVSPEVVMIDLEDTLDDQDIDENKQRFATDGLAQLNRKERKVVSRIFAILNNVLTPDLAKLVIDKIQEEFK